MMLRRPVAADVLDAHERLRGTVVETPLLRSDEIDARVGGRFFVKCENLQVTGAFKFRGAYNCLSRLDRGAYPGGGGACAKRSILTWPIAGSAALGLMATSPTIRPSRRIDTAASAKVICCDVCSRCSCAAASTRGWSAEKALDLGRR